MNTKKGNSLEVDRYGISKEEDAKCVIEGETINYFQLLKALCFFFNEKIKGVVLLMSFIVSFIL